MAKDDTLKVKEIKETAGMKQMKDLAGSVSSGQFSPEDLKKMTDLLNQQDADMSALDGAPGVVVDQKTGAVKLFGFKVPGMPPMMAQAIAIGYAQAATYINTYLGPKAYQATSDLVTKNLNMSETVGHRAGIGVELGVILANAHWQDAVAMYRAKGQYSNDIERFARKVAPVVDEIRGKHGVGATLSVKKDENEVIYNQRQRLSRELRVDMLSVMIAASGRIPITIAHLVNSHERWGREGKEAIADDHMNAKGEDLQAERAKEYKEKVGKYSKDVAEFKKMGLTEEEAQLRAKHLHPDIAKLDAAKGGAVIDKEAPSWVKKMTEWAPSVTTFLSEGFANNFIAQERAKVSGVTAYDMIMTLTSQLDNDPTMEAYALPDGMKLEDGRTNLPLNKYIAEIFRRHEADIREGGTIAKRLDEKLHDATEVIADALKDGDIDGLALISLVGERHVIKQGAKVIIDKEHVRDEVRRQMVKSRKHNTVDAAEYYQERSFTKHDLEAALKSLDGEERMWFASLFPDNVLEEAGIKQQEIKQIRSAATEDVGRHVLQYAQALKVQGEDFLKQHEATSEEQKRILEAAHTKEDDDKALRDLVAKPGKVEGVQHDVAQVLVQHIKHQGKLSDILQGKVHEHVANDNEHSANDNYAGDPDMKIDASSAHHEAAAGHAHER